MMVVAALSAYDVASSMKTGISGFAGLKVKKETRPAGFWAIEIVEITFAIFAGYLGVRGILDPTYLLR